MRSRPNFFLGRVVGTDLADYDRRGRVGVATSSNRTTILYLTCNRRLWKIAKMHAQIVDLHIPFLFVFAKPLRQRRKSGNSNIPSVARGFALGLFLCHQIGPGHWVGFIAGESHWRSRLL